MTRGDERNSIRHGWSKVLNLGKAQLEGLSRQAAVVENFDKHEAADSLFLRTRGRKLLGVSAFFGSVQQCVDHFSQEMGIRPRIRKQQGQRTAIWSSKSVAVMVFQPRKTEPVCASVMVKALTKRKS